MVEVRLDRDGEDMNQAPSLIASICIVVATLVVGPFGQAGGTIAITAAHSGDGVDLAGTIEVEDSSDTYDVSCGDSLLVDATDVITTDTDFGGTVTHAGQTLTARTDEAQFVLREGVVVCIDAEGPLLDGDGVVVGRWHLRPDGDGSPALHVTD